MLNLKLTDVSFKVGIDSIVLLFIQRLTTNDHGLIIPKNNAYQ
jgi:hypothetical protein